MRWQEAKDAADRLLLTIDAPDSAAPGRIRGGMESREKQEARARLVNVVLAEPDRFPVEVVAEARRVSAGG